VQGCAEGALAIVDGKARLVSEVYCDGLGACLGECPRGAIRTELREAPAYDQAAVDVHLAKLGRKPAAHGHHAPAPAPAPAAAGGCACAHGGGEEPAPHHHHHHGHQHDHGAGGCPGSRLRQLAPPAPAPAVERPAGAMAPSQLRSWPVQLALVPPQAGFLKGADILLCADCVPFAVPDFHQKYLAGRVVLVGCPKLDNLAAYTQKLAAIYAVAQPRSVTVLRMEVPCCAGLAQAANRAKEAIGAELPVETVIVGIGGEELG
jgi:hypothetical protein